MISSKKASKQVSKKEKEIEIEREIENEIETETECECNSSEGEGTAAAVCVGVTHREIFRFLFCFQRRFFNLPLQSGNDTGQRKAVAMCRRVGAHCRRRHAGGIKDSVLF